jgi:predicted nuclease with TOPRIM domain
MDIQDFMTYAGMLSTAIAAAVMAKAAWRLNTAKVWKEEAEAQKTRADRLQQDMDEIKERLSRIEEENKRLIELLTALDPERLRALRI